MHLIYTYIIYIYIIYLCIYISMHIYIYIHVRIVFLQLCSICFDLVLFPMFTCFLFSPFSSLIWWSTLWLGTVWFQAKIPHHITCSSMIVMFLFLLCIFSCAQVGCDPRLSANLFDCRERVPVDVPEYTALVPCHKSLRCFDVCCRCILCYWATRQFNFESFQAIGSNKVFRVLSSCWSPFTEKNQYFRYSRAY